jgi:membrane protease YdiL (CAAX protease family)
VNTTVRDKVTAVVALAAVGVHAVAGFRSTSFVALVATALSVALVPFSLRSNPAVRSLCAMLASLAVAMQLPVLWQPAMLLALLGFVAAGRAVTGLRAPNTWRARGRVPLVWTLLVGGVTPVALFAWMILFRPDLRDVVGAYVPDLPLPVRIVGGVGFAVVNAALEELIWRGVLQDRLGPLFGARGAIALQALSFGVQHFGGVPRGIVGVILAGLWGVMLGMLRRHARGLLAPFLAHVVADATLAVIVLHFAR